MKLGRKFGLSDREVSVMLFPMLKKSHIGIFFIVSVALALPHTTAASVVARVDAPPPVNVNGEAHAAKPVPKMSPTARMVKITLSLGASPANGAAVTLGKTWQGSLPEPDKIAVILGYDRGEWHIRGDRLRKRFTDTAVNPSSAGPRTLVARVRLDPDGAPVNVAFSSDGQSVSFAGMEADALLPWLDPRGWESVRVTARGGASNVFAEVRYIADGSLLIMR